MSGLRVGPRGAWVVAVAAGSVGGLSGATYSLLNGQARKARSIIGQPKEMPPVADGVYRPNGDGPVAPIGDPPLTLAVLGDSSAAGLGAESADGLIGVVLARGLATECRRPVRLVTHAVVGSRTADLAAQIDAALVDPPDVVLVMIGGNDVTAKIRVRTSAAMLTAQVERLTKVGCAVVVGTCPDLGTITPIPQPLRTLASRWSRTLAAAQAKALKGTSATVVPLAALLAEEFTARPAELFSPDRFHPNGAGYALAAGVLLAPICAASGVWDTAARG